MIEDVLGQRANGQWDIVPVAENKSNEITFDAAGDVVYVRT